MHLAGRGGDAGLEDQGRVGRGLVAHAVRLALEGLDGRSADGGRDKAVVVDGVAKLHRDAGAQGGRDEKGAEENLALLEDAHIDKGPRVLAGYRKQGRIALSGTYPRDKAGRYYGGMQNQRAAITVAADKCEGKIAREIKSRLLPTYLAELAKIRARIKKSDDHDALLLETHNKTAAAVGAQTYTEDELGFLPMRTKVWTNDLKLAGGMISSIQTGAGWVEIELRLPLDAALELLAQARPAGKEA